MKKLPFALICSLSAIAIGLSTWSLVRSYQKDPVLTEYLLYIGTNDKETYQLEMPLEDARSIVENAMMDHFPDGYTMYDAKGVWRDENHVITLEYSFVCLVEQADSKEVYAVADELLVKLNQNTILVVANQVHSVTFYQGK